MLKSTMRYLCCHNVIELFIKNKTKHNGVEVASFIVSADQPPKHMNFSQYVASNVPGLKGFREESVKHQNEIFTLKALSSVMLLLQRYCKIIQVNYLFSNSPNFINFQFFIVNGI